MDALLELHLLHLHLHLPLRVLLCHLLKLHGRRLLLQLHLVCGLLLLGLLLLGVLLLKYE